MTSFLSILPIILTYVIGVVSIANTANKYERNIIDFQKRSKEMFIALTCGRFEAIEKNLHASENWILANHEVDNEDLNTILNKKNNIILSIQSKQRSLLQSSCDDFRFSRYNFELYQENANSDSNHWPNWLNKLKL
ncbi:MAG: hypothetical protein R3B45_07415 [Bdellovibrionota bacterium]